MTETKLKKVSQIYYEYFGVILARDSGWEQGKGDCIFRSCIVGLANRDPYYIFACDNLIEENIRWPNVLNSNVKGRSQKSMTRDPYIMYIVACKLVGRIYAYRGVKFPFWLRRDYVKNWRRGLRGIHAIYHKRRYERQMSALLWWAKNTEKIKTFLSSKKGIIRGLRHKFGIHGYSLHIWAWMAYTIKSDRIKKELLPLIPEHNLLLRLLCEDTDLKLPGLCVNYTAKYGYQWTEMKKKTKKLPLGQKIQWDKDILMWAYQNRNK